MRPVHLAQNAKRAALLKRHGAAEGDDAARRNAVGKDGFQTVGLCQADKPHIVSVIGRRDVV